MKRFISLFLLLLLLLTPAACQSPAPAPSVPADPVQEAAPAQSDPAPETEPASPAEITPPLQSDPAPETEPAPEAQEPDLSALAAQLLDCGAFSYPMEEFEAEIGCNYYGLTEDAAEEMHFFFPPGPTADELVLFKAKDEAGVQELVKAVEARIDYQRHAFESYGPEEVKKLDNSYLFFKGVYVLFLAADDPSAADELLKPYF